MTSPFSEKRAKGARVTARGVADFYYLLMFDINRCSVCFVVCFHCHACFACVT